MSEKYFENFRTTVYNNNPVVDISQRTVVQRKLKNNPYLYYAYDINNDERADQLATKLYNNPYMSWILYLSNDIVDPYYEWYVDQNTFDDFILKKYKNIQDAQTKIIYYRNNYETDLDSIDVATYDAYPTNVKRYYTPQYDTMENIISYKRAVQRDKINTNMITEYTISGKFKNCIGKIATITFDTNITGQGEVIYSNGNIIRIKNCSGYVYSGQVDDVFVTENSHISIDNISIPFTLAKLIVQNIPYEEVVFWEHLTYYQMEIERNEYNKSLKIMNTSSALQSASELKELLK